MRTLKKLEILQKIKNEKITHPMTLNDVFFLFKTNKRHIKPYTKQGTENCTNGIKTRIWKETGYVLNLKKMRCKAIIRMTKYVFNDGSHYFCEQEHILETLSKDKNSARLYSETSYDNGPLLECGVKPNKIVIIMFNLVAQIYNRAQR